SLAPAASGHFLPCDGLDLGLGGFDPFAAAVMGADRDGCRAFRSFVCAIPSEIVRCRNAFHLPRLVPRQASRGSPEMSSPAVNVVQENRLAPVAAIHQVIYRARVLNAKLSRHAETRIKKCYSVNLWD